MIVNHISILINNQFNKKAFTEILLLKKASNNLEYLNKLNGVLFSDIAIQNIINEEYRYDSILVATENNRKLSSFSSGERRKKYLQYCINQNPDYIIIDSVFDHLDTKSQLEILEYIHKIAHQFQIVQLVNRYDDILNFIENKFIIKNDNFELEKIYKNPLKLTSDFKNAIPTNSISITYENNELVKFNNICVSYNNKKIVEKINWTINKGEFWQLTGPNGSGKSTLLSLITGDNAKAYGQDIFIFGQKKGNGESIWDLKKKIGYFSTTITELFSRNQPLEHLLLSGFFDSIGLYTKPQKSQLFIVDQWLKIIHLSAYKKTPFLKLSLGQQRIALIIRAIIKQPPLLILDEPLDGLDDENSTLVTQLINYLISNSEITVLYVSHRLEPRLLPTFIFELIPTENGSIGMVRKQL